MKITSLICNFLAVAAIVTALGFYSLKKHHPEDLGFHRAKMDDIGLIQLEVDKIRKTLRQGDPVKVAELLQYELPEADNLPAPFSEEPRHYENATGQTFTDFHIEEIDISEKSARVCGLLPSADGRVAPVQLAFLKKEHRWTLAASQGLTEVSATTSAVLGKRANAGGFQILTREDDEPSRTFLKRPISEEHGIERLTREVTREKLDRQLFEKPYASFLFSSVTKLHNVPYLSVRYVQLVTDPAWNRVVYGDYEGWIKAYGNRGGGPQDLNHPHGIDLDTNGNVYIADTGNHRIVVLKLEGDGTEAELKYQFAFGANDLMHPYDVAWDDSGTPFDHADDVVWIADTGHRRIVGYRIAGTNAALFTAFGKEGWDSGSFLEPKALAVGRFNGTATGILYVSDTGNRRIVQLHREATGLSWERIYQGAAESQFLSLDTDHWGNVYAVDRSYNELIKLSADLEALARINVEQKTLDAPLSFQVVFGQITLEDDSRFWTGYDQAFVIGRWTETSGAERYQLGLDINDFSASLSEPLDEISVASRITDQARMTLNVINPKTNLMVRQTPIGWVNPGDHYLVWDRRDDLGWQVEPGMYHLRLTAESTYGNIEVVKETEDFYLPLYYYEDCGSAPQRDAHLTQGERDSEWGAEPYKTKVTHPVEVVYRFTALNPSVNYEVQARFYNHAGSYLKQRIVVDDTEVFEPFEIPGGEEQVGWLQLPAEAYADGVVNIRFQKIDGELDAMVSELWIREANFDPANPPVASESGVEIPESFTLSQNYPNPFNPSTTIEFGVPAGVSEAVQLRIVNVLGQNVRELVDEVLPPGRHSVTWNGRDTFGRMASSGVYFYQLKAGDVLQVRKLILMK